MFPIEKSTKIGFVGGGEDMWVLISFILLSVSMLWAYPSREFCVYADKVGLDSPYGVFSTDTLKTVGFTSEGQPYRNNQTLTAPNTNYYYLIFTPANEYENEMADYFRDNNYMLEIRSTELIKRHDQQKGADFLGFDIKEINPLPVDYHRDFAVQVSS